MDTEAAHIHRLSLENVGAFFTNTLKTDLSSSGNVMDCPFAQMNDPAGVLAPDISLRGHYGTPWTPPGPLLN